MKDDRNNFVYLLFLVLLSIAVMLKQLVYPGYYCILLNDSITYTRWAHQFAQALSEGLLYPRWMPDEFWNYGSPTFILYSPLCFYLVALFKVFTGSIIQAMNYVKLLSLVVQGIGMYFLVKELYSRKTAFHTAAFYILFPYNLLQIYAFGPFAGNASWMWFSPIFLCLYRFFNRKQNRYLIYAGICYGGLLLTHLLTAYMFSFVMGFFVLLMSVRQGRLRGTLALPATVTIGLLISAAYVLPLIFERKFLQLNAFISDGPGYVYSNFFFLPDMTSKMPPNLFWPTYYPLLLTHASAIVAAVVFCSLLMLRYGREQGLHKVGEVNCILLLIFSVTIFFMVGLSAPVWEFVPFFKYIQFPARWLSQTIFVGTVVAAFGFNSYADSPYPHRVIKYVLPLIFLTLVFIDAGYIRKVAPLSQDQLSHVRPVWPEEHLPLGVNLQALEKEAPHAEAVTVEGAGKAEVVSWKSATREIKVAAVNPVTVKVRTLNFPGWVAYIDGKESETATVAGSKAIAVKIPSGQHRLKLVFSDTPVRRYGKLISLCSILLAFAFVVVSGSKEKVTS